MLLVEITINGTLNYVSKDGHDLTHNWRPRVIGFEPPQLAIPIDHGGFARMQWGKITFNPLLFAAPNYPPPVSCAIAIYHTDTTEAARATLFTGTAYLTDFNRESVTYGLYGPTYDEKIAAATAYNATLNTVLTTILTTIPEITSVNTTYARAVNPNVTHTVGAQTLAIDLASEIAAYYSHLFYIVGATAFLVDMKLSNGTDWGLDEFAYYSTPAYQYKVPLASVASNDPAIAGTVYTEFSAYPYGGTLDLTAYHTTEANIRACLVDILALENSVRVTLDVPMIAGNFPNLGQKITFTDTSHIVDISYWIRARKIKYDFMGESVRIEGDGAEDAA